MPAFSTSAIMLRRTDFGDYDLIITFFTLDFGKISLIAKSAKKSTKRFAGILELFSVLQVVAGSGRGRGLPVLQEATLVHPFSRIRADFKKMAYASYWAELINAWLEENEKQPRLFYLFQYALGELDRGDTAEDVLTIIFQMRFLRLSGQRPNITACSNCRAELEAIRQDKFTLNLAKGGVICAKCGPGSQGRLSLSKGTIKRLLWVEDGDMAKATRIRFTPESLKEGVEFLEAFVPYHLGKQPRSLKFLRQMRQDG